MTDLASRLRGLLPGGVGTATPRAVGRAAAAVDLDRLADAVGGAPFDTPAGRCLLVERRYARDGYHGAVRVGDCQPADAAGLAVLDRTLSPALVPDAARADPRLVFLDVETTGLSGGAGTVVFLVGCGCFEADAFHVRQFLLPAFGAERALLAAVSHCLAAADVLVTFNGRTFDLPVMETRWVIHRMEMPLAGKPHLDMLYPARRLWRARTPTGPAGASFPADRSSRVDFSSEEEEGCSLGALERALLRVRRVGDVPGWEIPSRYFQFLRTGDASPLEPVLEHNRLDLVSLAGLLARAARLVREGPDACAGASECLALGRLYARAGLVEPAARCYERSAAAREGDVRREALGHLARHYRRLRRHEEAAAAWQGVLALEAPGPAPAGRGRRPDAGNLRLAREALAALAVHEEHRSGNLAAARALAQRALTLDDSPRWRDLVGHRLARLEQKIEARRRGGWPAAVQKKGGPAAAPLMDPERPA